MIATNKELALKRVSGLSMLMNGQETVKKAEVEQSVAAKFEVQYV